ncbi:MAG: Eco57I restriction-modification methylase domain-containing protein [Terracidiphilus sp.]
MRERIDILEQRRLSLQAQLDGLKVQAERNRLGQFATPTALAREIMEYAAELLPARSPVHFLDPAIGTGSFYSALLSIFPARVSEALGFEIDRHYGEPAADLWRDFPLQVKLSDFTQERPCQKFNLVICNPPYVRHHHLENNEKNRLRRSTRQASGMEVNGLAGLYCHFLGLSHPWMTQNAIAGWLIPSEFMDVNYGQAVKQYLLDRVTLLRIHRFDPQDVQFADALVSSAIVWFRNSPPPPSHSVTFSYGGSLLHPRLSRSVPARMLAHEPKWTRFPSSEMREKSRELTLGEFFQIKRGLATGHNDFFILSGEDIESRRLPMELFTPILPSPRYLPGDEILSDNHGNPRIERRMFLLDTKLSEQEISRRFPTLLSYLDEGRVRGLHERYLCQHRSLWYGQENRPAAPILCTYLGRSDARSGRPFRFILNHSRATAANVYLAMYPTPVLVTAIEQDTSLIRRIWQALNSITPDRLLGEGRVYGGGLHKLEPKELANLPVPEIARLLPEIRPLADQGDLFEEIAV